MKIYSFKRTSINFITIYFFFERTSLKRMTKRYAYNPFQIFCFEWRAIVSAANQGANSSQITSCLASEWRSLPKEAKDYYVHIADTLKDNTRTATRCVNEVKQCREENCFTQFEAQAEKPLPLPRIHVVKRGNFGNIIEENSKKLLCE